MSVYFNSANNLSGNMSDCLYSDSTGIKHTISSIWGTKDNDVVKLWGKKRDDPYAVAPANAHLDWDYKLNETDGTITLNHYAGTKTNVTVYSSYELNGKRYQTKIGNYGDRVISYRT